MTLAPCGAGRSARLTLALSAVTLAACAAPSAAPPPPVDAAPVADCAAPPPHALEDTVDTSGDVDAELANLAGDIDALPGDIDVTALSGPAHDLVAYMLDEPALGFTHFEKADARGALLGDVVLGAFVAGGGGDVDVPLLRRGLFARYACARRQELRLDDFRARFGIDPALGADLGTDDVGEGDANAEVVASLPKHGPRRLLHVLADDAEIFLGETLVDDGAGATAVRETEALVRGLRDDGAVDFYAWDGAGDLVRSSPFATSSGAAFVDGPVPFTCMACHRDATGGTGYTLVRP